MDETRVGHEDVTGWHKSSYSEVAQACVEQGITPSGRVAVRDTKLGEASDILVFEVSEWEAFIATL